ncbi:MAG TPA: hypothetical protein DCR20_09260 [Planctomycetaceae bacterium]|nr:hypothetical protein [Planctomycetaceae bacterium]
MTGGVANQLECAPEKKARRAVTGDRCSVIFLWVDDCEAAAASGVAGACCRAHLRQDGALR